jgi:hypothetical protein
MTSTKLLTPKECTRWRRCSVRKLDRERAKGRGPRYVRIDGRVFYRPTDLDLFISAHVCGGDRGCSVPPSQTAPQTRLRRRPRKMHPAQQHMRHEP